VKRELPEDGRLLFFKYAFLNRLRDEAGMAVHHEKATVFHLLIMIALAGGPVNGIIIGKSTGSWLIGIVIGIIVSIVGLMITIPLPGLLWRTIIILAQKGWCLVPVRSENDQEGPVITRQEFCARKKAFEHDGRRHGIQYLIAIVLFYGVIRFLIYIGMYTEQNNLPYIIPTLVTFTLIGLVLAAIFWLIRDNRRLWRKHGLLCPACERRITNTAGFIEVPFLGLCKHCGAKIIK
jgi:hypothetical protein